MNKKELINQSIEYIIQHLEENLTVGDVAENIHFSEFYFSRMFKAETGQSVYAFMKSLKLDQSAIDLKLKKGKTITDIGLDYGYSLSNYSTAFRQYHTVSPAAFRKSANAGSVVNPFHPEETDYFETYEDYDARMKIQETKDALVIYERMIGNYEELKVRWFQFMDTYQDYIRAETLMLERFYDDPAIASLNRCICDLCITVDGIDKPENCTIVKGGKFAVYRFEGKISDIFCTLQGIFNIWLPQSGYEMRERYGINIYRNIDRAADTVIMDLHIPIK